MPVDYKAEYEYLRRQDDDRRWREEQEREREYQEREERRRQARIEYQQSQCYAENWLDAFNKAIPRFLSEQAMFDDGDGWFGQQAIEAEAGKALYIDAMKAIEPDIKALEEQIEALRVKAVRDAAEKLAAQYPRSLIVQAMRDNDPQYLVNW